VLLAGVAAFAPSASSENEDPLAGQWSLQGSNSTGSYTGTGTIEKRSDGRYGITLAYAYGSGKKARALFVGSWDGKTLTGERGTSKGIIAIFGGSPVRNGVAATYTLSADGSKLEGTIGEAHETLERGGSGTLLVDANRDGKVDDADKQAMQKQAALVTLVPGSPDAVRSPLVLDAKMEVTLAVTGAFGSSSPFVIVDWS
jgi:hypothetical protein